MVTRLDKVDAATSKVAHWKTPSQHLHEFFTLERLGKTWKQVRRESRAGTIRDCIDFRDWTQDIGNALKQLRSDIVSGDYQPESPDRFEMPKSKGAFRLITVLGIRDAIVFRAIADAALEAAVEKHRNVQGAYFSRRHAANPVGDAFSLSAGDSFRFFDIWLRYNEYRTRTMLSRPYNYLVVSDISNYFDSIHHELLMEHLAPLGIARPVIATLGRLLESLKPPAGFSPNPRVGIPVDEYDCSRQLAHLFLFEFDYAVCTEVGEDNYVRWMDDHNFGVSTLAEAHAAVNMAGRALAKQRLTVNSGKTIILRPSEVVRHFALDINQEISRFEEKWGGLFVDWKEQARADFEIHAVRWRQRASETGVQDKIFKRMYGIAGKVGSQCLDRFAYIDLLRTPSLAGRVFSSLASRNQHALLLKVFQRYVRDGHSLYDSIEATFFDSLLRLDVDGTDRESLKEFCVQFSMGSVEGQSGGSFGIASSLLAAYWFGADSQNILELYTDEELSSLPAPAIRSWFTILRAASLVEYDFAVQKSAPVQSADVARLMRYFQGLQNRSVKNTYLDVSPTSAWPSRGKYVDPRKWLLMEVFANSRPRYIKRKAKVCLGKASYYARTVQEKAIAARIASKVSSLDL